MLLKLYTVCLLKPYPYTIYGTKNLPLAFLHLDSVELPYQVTGVCTD